jgi:hypothetical protein
MKNKGLFHERINHNPREKAFAETWEHENERPDKFAVDHGYGTLQNLFTTGHKYDIMDPLKWVLEITDHDKYIVATVVQWLGSNVGMSFLHTALKKCGYTIVGTMVEKPVESHQQRVVDEKAELDKKAHALSQFIGLSPIFETLDPAEQERLKEQNDIMWQYSEILGMRIWAFQQPHLPVPSHEAMGSDGLCEWSQEDEGSGRYTSPCGVAFIFNDGGPVENGFVFCPKCGKKLKEIPWVYEGDSAEGPAPRKHSGCEHEDGAGWCNHPTPGVCPESNTQDDGTTGCGRSL